MPMAPAAPRAPPGSLSRSSFLAPSRNAARSVRLGANRAVILGGVAPRSGRRDGEWGGGADPDPSTGTGRMVDEDMATLRRRIREARAAMSEDDDDDFVDGHDDDADADADAAAPLLAAWTELERRHHGRSCVAGVRGAACILEAFLVNARPGLGAGVLALLLLGVPVSVAFLVGAKLVQAVDAISSAVNGR